MALSSSSPDQQHLAWLARSFGRPDYLPLSTEDLKSLRGAGEVITKHKDTHLFREGEPSRYAYLVEEGQVGLYRGPKRDRRVIARVGPGSVIGDIALFSGDPYISSARAVTHVTAFRFDRDRLMPELALRPAICLRWLVAGLRQLEETQLRVIHLLSKTVKAQVADVLLEDADAHGEVRLSQETLALLLGTTRQSVNEALGALKQADLVETGYGVVRILDAEGLRAATAAER